MEISVFKSNLVAADATRLSSANQTKGSPLGARAASVRQSSAAFNVGDAANVELSNAQKTNQQKSQSALTALSDTSSFVSIAQSAADSISKLLDEAKSRAEQLDNTVDQQSRDALATEIENVLAEVNSINSNATFNDTSVVNAGAIEVSVNLDGADQSGLSEFIVTIPNAQLSEEDLGIDGLTASQIEADTEAAIDTIDEAKSLVGSVENQLDNAASQIADIGDAFGLRAELNVEAAEASKQAEALAEQVASQLSGTLSEVRDDINGVKTADILSETEPIARETEDLSAPEQDEQELRTKRERLSVVA